MVAGFHECWSRLGPVAQQLGPSPTGLGAATERDAHRAALETYGTRRRSDHSKTCHAGERRRPTRSAVISRKTAEVFIPSPRTIVRVRVARARYGGSQPDLNPCFSHDYVLPCFPAS